VASVPTNLNDPLEQLSRSFNAVGRLIREIQPSQWDAPTPCEEWTLRRLLRHLIGMNLIFAAMLLQKPPPPRDLEFADDELEREYRKSSAALMVAFSRPGALGGIYHSPMGSATGADRLRIRMYDLLAHGWDIAHAIGQPAQLPEDAAEAALSFVRGQLHDNDRPGRFAAEVPMASDAPASERLAGFLGRRPDWQP
jgi:uncharacterized protein (TIGR03086 family)